MRTNGVCGPRASGAGRGRPHDVAVAEQRVEPRAARQPPRRRTAPAPAARAGPPRRPPGPSPRPSAAGPGTRRPGTPRRGPPAGRPYSAPPRAPRRRPGCARRPRPSRQLPGHRIAIDARAAARPELGGVERWARELATRLPALRPDAYEVLTPPPRLVHRAGHAWEQLVLPLRAARARALLCPANLAPLAFPRNVVVIHDAAALRHPEWYSPAYAAWQRRVLPALARRALHVVTVSEFSRNELVDLLAARPSASAWSRAASTPPSRRTPTRRPPAARSASPAPTSSASPPRPRARTCAALVPAARQLAADGVEVVVAGGHRPQFAREAGPRGAAPPRRRARRAAARPLRGRRGVRAALALRGLRPAACWRRWRAARR